MYEILSRMAQTVGLLLFVSAFIMVLVYTFLPANRDTFRHAARKPLDDGALEESPSHEQ